MRTWLTPERRNLIALAGAWAVLMWVVFATRPLMPIDELRYASVAWEMWLRGDLLVPHLNGQPYSHKPPLLFWLIDAGWLVFGVSELWTRLVAPLFGVITVLAMPSMFRLVWPERPERAAIAPWILFGALLWTVVGTVTMFDMLNALFALGAVAGLVLVWRGRHAAGWAAFGLCVGLGILAKGPVILVYALPPLLLAPWWLRGQGVHWWRWASGAAGALALGAVVALAWAIPAGFAGGDEYRAAILWGQTAGRGSESFAHARAIWWYLPLLPLALFPWLLWPRVWRGLRRLWRTDDPGLRLCIAWAGGGLVMLSLVSGKQPHYLIPLLPAVALIVAATLPEPARRPGRDLLIPGAATVLVGAGIAGLVAWIQAGPGLAALDLPEFAVNISVLCGAAI
ncbi:MAG: glycosyltransferase family 39 protein, partial [Proteobacteria bacterium]|nr:glycosyltransferase family 39 protein [Pseudomonadota bacterium]